MVVSKAKLFAFGKALGQQDFIPRRPLPQNKRDIVGQFSFCIGTFEQNLTNTTHTEQQFKHLLELAKDYGGLAVYRNEPYGRSDSGFFKIEESRMRHAGRAFFS